MKKQNLVSIAVGSAFAAAALTPMASAADNPFCATQLQAGYQLAQADTKKKDASAARPSAVPTRRLPKEEGRQVRCRQEGSEGKCGADKKPAEKKM